MLLAADGVGNHEIARRLEISRGQVIAWRDRFAKGGVAAIESDLPRSGRKLKEWLEKHPRFHVHFTPTSASWLNMVERFFRSVPELIAATEEYIAVHNQNPKPFVWIAKANDILQKVIRANRKLGSKKNEALH